MAVQKKVSGSGTGDPKKDAENASNMHTNAYTYIHMHEQT